MNYWPFLHYSQLKSEFDQEGERFYYLVDNDKIINEQEVENYMKTQKYRKNDKYFIIGSRSLINEIYTIISRGEIPENPYEKELLIIPEIIQDFTIKYLQIKTILDLCRTNKNYKLICDDIET